MFSILIIVAVTDNGAVFTLLYLLSALIVVIIIVRAVAVAAVYSPRLLVIALLIVLLALPLRLLLLSLAVAPRDRGVNKVFVYLDYKGQDRATEAVSSSVNPLWHGILYVFEEDRPLDKIVHSYTSRTEFSYQNSKSSRLLAPISIAILVLT